jgi:SAM-dependent methyltransferase
MKDTEIRQNVREGYGKIAREAGSSCCGPNDKTPCCGPKNTKSCCGAGSKTSATDISKNIGYTDEDINSVPDGANLGLGCGNPLALASLKEGETVLDLGSGAGFDCFLAANKVGKTGKVIGVDMTPEMLEKARDNARKNNYTNVEFRMGEIENLPVADGIVDVIISNCVINLSVDKDRVFKEAYRVLKSGGRLMVSDIVLEKELPETVRVSIQAYIGCVSGAMLEKDYLGAMENAGFKDVRVAETGIAIGSFEDDPVASSIAESLEMTPEQMQDLAGTIKSVRVSALK